MSSADKPAGSRSLIFGTDGVRDKSGEGLLAPSSVEWIVRAAARVLDDAGRFQEDFPSGRGTSIVIARDTRRSGEELSREIAAVFAQSGFDVHDLGVLPTPGAAWIASTWPGTALGVVISASHNPAEYNGIKLVAPTGGKITPDFEKAVSDEYWRRPGARPGSKPGRVTDRSSEAREAYTARLVKACGKPERLAGRRVGLDAANGAAYLVATEVFRRLGAEVEARGNAPDGVNINLGCGALHPEELSRLVVAKRAAIGFCFDGDADRMIPVTARGTVLNGDHALYVSGLAYHRAGKLPRRKVIATTMSNIGLEIALGKHGVELTRTDVGDRNVYLEMMANGHPIGGEQSGHIIYLDDARTGDGILAAVRLVDFLAGDHLDLDAESEPMKSYPQLLKNVRVAEKVPLDSLPAVHEAVAAAGRKLAGQGRIVLRYSGTEPLARVMLEGPDLATVEELTRSICDAIRSSIPGSK